MLCKSFMIFLVDTVNLLYRNFDRLEKYEKIKKGIYHESPSSNWGFFTNKNNCYRASRYPPSIEGPFRLVGNTRSPLAHRYALILV